jgi:hypothetical protein
MALTQHRVLRQWLVISLAEQGGEATKAEALAFIEARFGDELTSDDWLRQPSNNETKWRNRAAFERQSMIQDGLLVRRSPYNRWTLSDAGWNRYRTLRPQPRVAPAKLWAFKPKSDREYRARIAGRELVKSRSHETLVNDFARYAMARGFGVDSPHPRDLTLNRNDSHWLVEAKVVRNGCAPGACREAVAQLLDYRHFLYDTPDPVSLVALFNEDVGGAYRNFLNSLTILVVWRRADDWSGCPLATGSGIV